MPNVLNFLFKANKKFFPIFYTIFIFFTFYTFIFDHSKIDIPRISFMIITIFLFFKKKLDLSDLFDKTIILIIFFFFISLLTNIHNRQPIDDIFRIINWIFPYIFAKLLIKHNKIQPQKIIYIFCTVTLALASIALISQLFSLNILFGKSIFCNGRFVFTMSNTNRAAFYLSISTLLLLALLLFEKKINNISNIYFFYIPVGITIFALMLTAEKKSIFMLPFFILIFLVLSKKYKAIIFFISIAVLILLVYPLPKRLHPSNISIESSTVSARLAAWEIAIHLFKERPLIGHGFGSYKEKSTEFFRKNPEKIHARRYAPLPVAHNINLNTLAETGIIGFFIMNAVFLIPFFTAYKQKKYDLFSMSLILIILFIYLQMQFGNFVQASHRTDLTFLLLGICSQIPLRTSSQKLEPLYSS